MKRDCCFMKPFPILFLLLSFSCCIHNIVHAQGTKASGKTVKGTVTNSKGDPLPGVSVVLKGSATGVATDDLGKYAINATDTSLLVFSYVGITPQEIPVNGQSVINVKMQTDNSATTL